MTCSSVDLRYGGRQNARMHHGTGIFVACVVAAFNPTGLSAQTSPAPESAQAFVQQAEKELADHSVLQSRTDWINETYINEDTDALAAMFGARGTELSVRFAKGAAKYAGAPELSFDLRRKLNFLRQGIVLPASNRPGAAEELNTIATGAEVSVWERQRDTGEQADQRFGY